MKNTLAKYKNKEELLVDIKEKKILSIKMGPLSYYVKVLNKLGFNYLNELFDTNGWEVDFWAYFADEKITLMISGSLYKGNFKLTIDDEK